MNANLSRIALFLLLAAGLAASAIVLSQRDALENSRKTVRIVLDKNDLDTLTYNASPERREKFYREIQGRGPITLAIYEETLESLQHRGLAKLEPGMALKAEIQRGAEFGLRELSGNCETALKARETSDLRLSPMSGIDDDTMALYLSAYFEGKPCRGAPGRFLLPTSVENALELFVGFRKDEVDLAHEMGFGLAVRLKNAKVDTPDTLAGKLIVANSLSDNTLVIYDGGESLGYPGAIDKVVAAFKDNPGLQLGEVELIEQKGIQEQAAALKSQLIPTHSVGVAELQAMNHETLVARFLRAVQDRGVKAVYFRLFASPFGTTLEERAEANLSLLDDFLERMAKAGYVAGVSMPMPSFDPNPIMRPLIAAGMVAFVGLFAMALFSSGGLGWAFVAISAAVALAGAAMQGLPSIVLKIFPLGVASLAPPLALAAFFMKKDGPGASAGSRLAVGLPGALASVLAAGVLIAALLSDREHFLRLQSFAGVKLAFLLPLALTLFCWAQWSAGGLGGFLKRPLLYGEVFLGIALLGVAAVYILRSDNISPIGVPGWERLARDWLEALLTARPRTKEFMVGYPCLGLLVAFGISGKGRWSGLVLLLGAAIGFVSVVNTFCHFHTPIAFSLLRIRNGMLLGVPMALAAIAVIFAAGRLLPKWVKTFLEESDRVEE